MLQNMRENFTGKFALVLLAMIGLSFVFFGLNYSFIGNPWVAKVDGEEISAVAFEQSYRDALQRNPQLASIEGELRLQVRRNLLDQLVSRQLIDNYLNDNGYRISDEQIVRFVQNTPEFQADGKFDRDTYRAFLAERGLEPIQFEQLQRDALRQQQLQLAVGATAIVTPAEYRRYLNLMAEQRVVSLASLNQEVVEDAIEISDDMISAWYESNPQAYQLPESVDIEYLVVSRDAVAEGIEVSEDELTDYYEDNRDRFLQDEQRRARHILIEAGDDEQAARAEAEAAYARVQAGESFAAVAEEVSDDGGTAAAGGDLGALTRSQLPGELGSAIFSMEAGEVAGPVQSDFGFHVIELEEILAQGPLPLAQVRGELLSELREREANNRYEGQVRSMSDALFDNEDINAIAAATGLELQSASEITRQGGGPIGSNQAAIDAIFAESALSGKQVTDVIELDANRTAIFKVANYREATRQALDEVREEIVADLTAQQAATLMAGRAEQMLEALKGGKDFAEAAATAGLQASEPQMLTRTSTEVDQELVFEVFAAGKPSEEKPVRGRLQLHDGSYVVYTLDAVLPGRPESIPLAERDQGKLMLAQQAGIGDFQAFVASLRASAKIVINDDVLAADDLFQ
jgi:peptidyl-prolyl cis-trans isomerase D